MGFALHFASPRRQSCYQPELKAERNSSYPDCPFGVASTARKAVPLHKCKCTAASGVRYVVKLHLPHQASHFLAVIAKAPSRPTSSTCCIFKMQPKPAKSEGDMLVAARDKNLPGRVPMTSMLVSVYIIVPLHIQSTPKASTSISPT